MKDHYCKFCDGKRPNDGEFCLGCGSQLAKCARSVAPDRVNVPRCPICSSKAKPEQMADGQIKCSTCLTLFEKTDFSFLDTRPDVNAQKKEKAARDARKRGAYRTHFEY